MSGGAFVKLPLRARLKVPSLIHDRQRRYMRRFIATTVAGSEPSKSNSSVSTGRNGDSQCADFSGFPAQLNERQT